jgi:GTPase SAR1 family protein
MQDFHKPFDAPAVIVVGHQTSGKSALIEALMGFQFNQVNFVVFLYIDEFLTFFLTIKNKGWRWNENKTTNRSTYAI